MKNGNLILPSITSEVRQNDMDGLSGIHVKTEIIALRNTLSLLHFAGGFPVFCTKLMSKI
jgi:hypothetical protein